MKDIGSEGAFDEAVKVRPAASRRWGSGRTRARVFGPSVVCVSSSGVS